MKAVAISLAIMLCLCATTQLAFSQWSSVAPGIDYQKYTMTMSDGKPNNVFVTRMDRSNTDCIIDSSIAQGQLRTVARETVSNMATRYDDTINYWGQSWGQRSDVIVAINGSGFNYVDPGPTGGQVISGWQAKRWGNYVGSGFVWKIDRSCFMGGDVRDTSTYQYIYFANGGSTAPTNVNATRAGTGNELIVYTPQFADNTYTDNTGTEVLVEMTRPLVDLPVGGPNYVYGTIKQVRPNAGSTPIPFDHVVLSGTGSYATILAANCAVGDQIRFQFEIHDYGSGAAIPFPPQDWTKAYASVGCFAYVLINGALPTGDWQPGDGSDIRNPRTSVAYNDNYIYFFVCDGRSTQSVGMTYPELGTFCRDQLGATWAANQDGGGSSAIWVNGQIKNVPSDGSERAVANGLFMIRVQPKVQTTTFVPVQLVTTNTTANVRLGPGTNYGVLTSVASGTQGHVVSQSLNGVQAKGYNWWKVDFSSTVGWVAESLLIGGGIGPTITQQPAPQTAAVGGTATFTVAASGDTPLTYQWQKNGANLSNGGHYSGVTTASLSVSNADSSDAADYRCVVSNAYGTATSNAATLTLSGKPTITQQPLPQNICTGGTAVFAVAASGEGTLTYQWRKNSANVTDGGHYSGATTTTLTVSNADSGDAASYRCVVTNAAGSTNSNQAPLTLNLVAGILGMGGTNSSISGVSTDGSVVAGNNSAGGFIWSRTNGVVTLGATTSTAGAAIRSGNVVVGGVSGGAPSYWTGSTAGVGSWTALPTISGGFTPQCTAASDANANIWVGGYSGSATGSKKACRYKFSSNSLTNLSLPSSSYQNDSYVNGISDSGTYAIQAQFGGTSPSGSRQAVGGGGTTALYPLQGPPSTSNSGSAKTVSRDGTKAAGWSSMAGAPTDHSLTIWTISNPTVPFQVPYTGPDNWGELLALNTDGSVAAGYALVSGNNATKHAIIWDAANGTRDLAGWLTAQYSLDLTGWTLTEVKGISGDGNVITGNGTHNGVAEAWVVLLNAPAQAPTITQHPAAQIICPQAMATFTVAATGLGTLSYQWQKGGSNLANGGHYSGVTTSTLTVSNADGTDAGDYRCVISIGCNSTTSNAATLTVRAATTITQHPSGQSVCPDAQVQFVVAATGEGALSYQWRKNQGALINGGNYSGVTTATLTIASAGSDDAAGYDCVVTAGCGSATSNPATLALNTGTSIAQQPAPQQVASGETAQFTVSAGGDGTITYQWQKNDVDLTDGGHYSGALTATLTVTGANGNDAANYRCVVTAGCGTVTSNEAALTLTTGVASDFDQDGDVDLLDFGLFQSCFNGPNRPAASGCAVNADLDHDNDVDLNDFSVFQGCFNGPNRPPACS